MRESWTILIVLHHHQGQLFLLNAIRGYRGYSPKGLAVGTRSVGTRSRFVYRVCGLAVVDGVFFWHMPSVVVVIAASHGPSVGRIVERWANSALEFEADLGRQNFYYKVEK